MSKRRQEFEDYLAHYGILGMKWGVRRYQPYPPGKHGTFLGQTRDEDIHFKKGTKAYRVQASKELNPNSKATYVSLSRNDHLAFVDCAIRRDKIAMDCTWNQKDLNGGRPFAIRVELQKDLVAPSYNKTMKAFIDTVDKVGMKNVIEDDVELGKMFINSYKKVRKQDALDDAYNYFAAQFMKDTKARNIFFENLEKQGYNGVVDEFAKGFDKRYGTEAPMIVFKSEDLKKTAVKPIKDSDVDHFMRAYWGDDDYIYNPGTAYKKKTEEWDDWAYDRKSKKK